MTPGKLETSFPTKLASSRIEIQFLFSIWVHNCLIVRAFTSVSFITVFVTEFRTNPRISNSCVGIIMKPSLVKRSVVSVTFLTH